MEKLEALQELFDGLVADCSGLKLVVHPYEELVLDPDVVRDLGCGEQLFKLERLLSHGQCAAITDIISEPGASPSAASIAGNVEET